MPGYELFGAEERNAILEWFDSSNGVMFAHGFDGLRNGVYKVREFEKEIAARVDAGYAQVVSSGSAALLVSLQALGIRPGDEVITQSFTFVATVEAILESGATPVITEVDDSLTMDPADLERRIGPKTRAIMPVHMAGASADMDGIMAIAARHGLPVIEDAAQAFGASYRGRPLGTIGHAGTYSFDFAKILTTGEGGAIVTNDAAYFQRVRARHDHGHDYNPNFPRGKDTRQGPGFNYRMTEVQAAVGLAQLRKLEIVLEGHRRNKAALKAAIGDCGLRFRRLHDPQGEAADTLVFFLPDEATATAFARRLSAEGIATKNLPDALDWHFAGTWGHMFSGIPSLADPESRWPRSAELLRRSIALPVTVKMGPPEIARVASVVRTIAMGVAV